MYQIAFKGSSHVIFQNSEDMDMFLKLKLISLDRPHLIKSSGVNTEFFSPSTNESSDDLLVFTMISRMIWDKGIGIFCEAAKIIKQKYPLVQFVLAGGIDNGNPNSVPESYLETLNSSGIVNWTGHLNNVKELIEKSDVIVLPTYYREGVPRSLIEGASMAKPLIAKDVPGCREIVKDGYNGILVIPKDVSSLVEAMLKLIQNPSLKSKMGINSRKLAIEEFDERIVIQDTLRVYRIAGL